MTAAAVTLYKENRRDQAHQRSPEELAAEFVATLRGERYPDYRPSGSLRIDDQFAWWLGDPKAENSTWDHDDCPALMDALGELIDSDEDARRTILDAINPWGALRLPTKVDLHPLVHRGGVRCRRNRRRRQAACGPLGRPGVRG